MVKILRLAAALLLCSAAAAAQNADPFHWLEAQHASDAVAWAKERTDCAVAALTAKPDFPAVAREIRDGLAASAPRPTLYLLGRRYVRLLRDAEHPAGLLQVAPRAQPASWRTVLDVGALNRREGASYVLSGLSMYDFPGRCLPPDFDRCLIPLSPGGSSNLELREFDLASGNFVEGGFRTAANRSFTAWLDRDRLLIAHSLDGSPALPSNFPAVAYLWTRGTGLADARKLLQAPPTASLVEFFAFGTGAERRGLVVVAQDYATIDYHLVERDGRLSRIDLPQKVKYVGRPALSYPYLAVQLAEPATIAGVAYPAEAIVAWDVRTNAIGTVHIPQAGSFVGDGIEGTGTGFAFVEDRNLRKTLLAARRGVRGWRVQRSLSAPPGDTLSVLKPDGVTDALLVEQKGFLTPPAIRLFAGTAKPRTVEQAAPVLDAHDFTVEIRAARSKDGTGIDYYLVRSTRAAPGPVPTLMTGYGSFGLSFSPDYFTSGLGRGMVSWLNRGGAYVVAAIRGGGERGAAWHLAGSGVNKQTSFDDFIAVAEDLVQSGVTVPAKLGAFGRSAGGLLAAVMVTQRPDLFGAVFVGVPVTDVSALASSGAGIVKGQKTEFGDWDDPQVLPKILAWSPYQNVRANLRYPRVLVMTSTEDNQVGPGQARKFAAALEAAGAQPLLIEAAQGGHGVPDPLKQPELVAAETVFFLDALTR
jgi:prolyl oligopeptidase